MTTLIVRWLGQREYLPVWHAMQRFTADRNPETPDEIWLLEHPPVYTVGVRGRSHYHFGAEGGKGDGVRREQDTIRKSLRFDPRHRETPSLSTSTGDIPLVHTDRGGLITYHGPGQLIVYTLIDLARRHISVRDLVSALEKAVMELLKQYGIHAQARRDAPGVYVEGAKIASLGLRVRKFRSYHGLSLNVDLDLAPFYKIDPCGLKNLQVTRLADLGARVKVHEVAVPLLISLMALLQFNTLSTTFHQLPEEETKHAPSV